MNVGGPFLNAFYKIMPDFIHPLNSLFDIDVPSQIYRISKHSILEALNTILKLHNRSGPGASKVDPLEKWSIWKFDFFNLDEN